MTIKSSTSKEVTVPAMVADLADFIATVPPEAELSVQKREGGTQRDPYTTGYVFTAKWETP